MIERLEPVTEEIAFLRDFYLIAASMIIHSWQSGLRVGLPRMNHVPHVLRLRHLAQVLNSIIRRVEVYVVQLHRGKMPVMPSPDGTVKPELITLAIDVKFHIQITAFTISLCALIALYHAVRLGVDKLSAAFVVVIILLDASGQCRQLAIR